MQQSDYPYLFQASDSSSLSEQKTYINFLKIDFFFIISAAYFAGFNLISQNGIIKYFAIGALIALIFSIIFKLIIQLNKWDRKWFDTRAVAESVKTATWRYIIGAEPYEISLGQQASDKKFIGELDEILKSRPTVTKSLAKGVGGRQQVSERMRGIRNMNLQERKQIYLKQRVQDQKNWYSNKASFNNSMELRWFWITIITEGLAIIFAIYISLYPNILFNPIGTLTTLAVVISAWTQAKKYRELNQSYALAAQELSSIESLAIHVGTEKELSDYVISAENAISKEHTLWCAKRTE